MTRGWWCDGCGEKATGRPAFEGKYFGRDIDGKPREDAKDLCLDCAKIDAEHYGKNPWPEDPGDSE